MIEPLSNDELDALMTIVQADVEEYGETPDRTRLIQRLNALRGAAAIVVRPGDTLVMVLPDTMTTQETEEAFQVVKERLPDDCRAVIVGGSIRVHVIRGKVSDS